MEKYLKGTTTTGTKFVPFEMVKAPVFIACTEPAFKPSFYEEHEIKPTIENSNLFWFAGYGEPLTKQFANVSNVKGLFQEMTYTLGKDLKFSYVKFFDLKMQHEMVDLNVGENSDGVEVIALPTIFFGMCYKIKPYYYFPHRTDQMPYYTDVFQLVMTRMAAKKDNIAKMVVWVTDEQSWDGIIANEWDQIEPTR